MELTFLTALLSLAGWNRRSCISLAAPQRVQEILHITPTLPLTSALGYGCLVYFHSFIHSNRDRRSMWPTETFRAVEMTAGGGNNHTANWIGLNSEGQLLYQTKWDKLLCFTESSKASRMWRSSIIYSCSRICIYVFHLFLVIMSTFKEKLGQHFHNKNNILIHPNPILYYIEELLKILDQSYHIILKKAWKWSWRKKHNFDV